MITLCAFLVIAATPAEAAIWRLGPPDDHRQVVVDAYGARVGNDARIGTGELSRGEWRSAPSTTALRAEDGSVVLNGARVTERWLDRDGAVEQRWELQRPPPGRGPLRVRVPLHGLTWVRDDDRGVTLARRSGRELTYGHGFLIDARGRRWDVPAAHRDGAIHLRVPERVLAEATFPVVLDPTISAPQEIFPREPGVQFGVGTATAAYTGAGYALLWNYEGTGLWSHLDDSGAPQGSTQIFAKPYLMRGLGSDGNESLVVSVSGTFLSPKRFTAVRFDSQGNPLQTTPTDLGGQFWATEADVVWTGSHYNVAWANRIARVTSGGTNLDPGGAMVPDAHASGPLKTKSASTVGISLVVTSDLHAFRRDDATGVWLDTTPLQLGTGPVTSLAVATDGAAFFVVWRDGPSLLGARVSTAGVVLDPGGFVIATGSFSEAVAVSFEGPDYLVAWASDGSAHAAVHVARVSSLAVVAPASVLDASTFPYGTWFWRLSLVPGATGTLLVAWAEYLDYLVVSTHIAQNGGAGPWVRPALLPIAGQEPPFELGTAPFLAWVEDRTDGKQLYVGRLGANGSSLDGSGVAVGRATHEPVSAAVARDGPMDAVAWSQPLPPPSTLHRVLLARVDATGAVLDVPPIEVHLSAFVFDSLRLACGGSECLVTWFDGQVSRAARVDASGAVLGGAGGFTLPLESVFASGHDGSAFIVIGKGVSGNLFAVAVDGNGMTSADAGLALGSGQPVMACEPTRCLVVSSSSTPPGGMQSLFVASSGGTITVGPGLAIGAGIPSHLAWDGQSHLLVTFAEQGVRLLDGLVASSWTPVNAYTNNGRTTLVPRGVGRFSVVAEEQVQTSSYTAHSTGRLFQELLEFDEPMVRVAPLTTDEDTQIAVTLTGEDPQGDALSFAVVSQPSQGAVSGASPDFVYSPAENFHGDESFEVEASDGLNTSGPVKVMVTVKSVNDAPVANDMTLTLTQGDPSVTLRLSASDVDGDALTTEVVAPPVHAATVHALPDLNVRVEPRSGFRGTETFTWEVSDGQLTASAAFTLTVENVPPTTTLTALPTQVPEGEPVHFNAEASDPGGDALTFQWDFGDGATATGEQAQHVFKHHGTWTVTLTVSDGLAQTQASTSVVVTNLPPTLSAVTANEVDEGTPVRLEAEVLDPGAGDVFTYVWSFPGSAPLFTQTPWIERLLPDDGVYPVEVSVSDSADASSNTHHVNVVVRNVAPSISPQEDVVVQPGEWFDLPLSAVDPGGAADPLTWTLLEGPGALGSEGRYTFLPQSSDVGDHVMRARVEDDDGGSDEFTFRIRVASAQAAAGCACDAGLSGGAVWLGLLGLVAAAGRRRRS